MIVPRFWAEARLQHQNGRKQVTVRRWGWSDTSEDDAMQMANTRAAEALQRIVAGEKLLRREAKEAYGGANGIPIREEIISEHGTSVITRNSYGALCLNTTQVFFADIDFDARPRYRYGGSHAMFCLAAAGVAGTAYHSLWWAIAAAVAAHLSIQLGLRVLNARHRRLHGSPAQQALARIQRFSASHPDWNLRVYETPAGYRLLAMHDVFDPSSAETSAFFAALETDKIYAAMCRRQHCFRARVSPKPWRIGIPTHLRPRPGVWPVKPEYLPQRREWVAAYDAAAAGYSSCRFLVQLGSSQVHPEAETVRLLHDDLCQAHTALPIA